MHAIHKFYTHDIVLKIGNTCKKKSETITLQKAQKWAVVQVVKVFLGMPVIPGK